MSGRNPSPGSRSLAALSRKGRGLEADGPAQNQPSPLAGEGAAHRAAGEGATLEFAKGLRRRMTDAETRLWQELRAKRFESYKFRRQVPIGKYIVDFVCFEHRLIVEVDGSQHDESIHDAVRDAWLEGQGFRLLRLWNREALMNVDGALRSILALLRYLPHPELRSTFPREGGRKKS